MLIPLNDLIRNGVSGNNEDYKILFIEKKISFISTINLPAGHILTKQMGTKEDVLRTILYSDYGIISEENKNGLSICFQK